MLRQTKIKLTYFFMHNHMKEACAIWRPTCLKRNVETDHKSNIRIVEINSMQRFYDTMDFFKLIDYIRVEDDTVCVGRTYCEKIFSLFSVLK